MGHLPAAGVRQENSISTNRQAGINSGSMAWGWLTIKKQLARHASRTASIHSVGSAEKVEQRPFNSTLKLNPHGLRTGVWHTNHFVSTGWGDQVKTRHRKIT